MVLEVPEKKPNAHLKFERERRGWTQGDLATHLCEICDDTEIDEHGFIDGKRVSTWELGKHTPNHFWRIKLCLLFEKSLEELGLVLRPVDAATDVHAHPSRRVPQTQTFAQLLPAPTEILLPLDVQGSGRAYFPHGILPHGTHHQVLDTLLEHPEVPIEQQLGAWLALRASDLAYLFDAQWSSEDILASLQVILKGVQAVHNISRRHLLELGAAALVGGISTPSGRHVSFEERSQLCLALGESIAAGWSLFHTAGNAQVLAVSHAQLLLVQQMSSQLYSNVRPMMYSGAYRLMGAALYFQGRYEEADQKHDAAYAAALEGPMCGTWHKVEVGRPIA